MKCENGKGIKTGYKWKHVGECWQMLHEKISADHFRFSSVAKNHEEIDIELREHVRQDQNCDCLHHLQEGQDVWKTKGKYGAEGLGILLSKQENTEDCYGFNSFTPKSTGHSQTGRSKTKQRKQQLNWQLYPSGDPGTRLVSLWADNERKTQLEHGLDQWKRKGLRRKTV